MTTIQTLILTALLFVWLCISISFLVMSIQSFVYDRKREKRELVQAERDKEYHEKRMENLLNKYASHPRVAEQSAALLG